MVAAPTMCFRDQTPPVEIALDVALSGSSQADLRWTFSPSTALPPNVIVRPNGDMDFRARRTSLLITMTLNDASGRRFYVGNGINVFGYADSDGSYTEVTPVQPNNHQIRVMSVSDDGRTVTFCYHNHNRRPGQGGGAGGGNGNGRGAGADVVSQTVDPAAANAAPTVPRSRYTIYLGAPGSGDYLPYWIDPIISNGGNTES